MTMNLLLDTQPFLWAVWDDKRLSGPAADAFLDPRNTLHFSVISYWEICLKNALGKLTLANNWVRAFDEEMAINGIHWLELKQAHCLGIIDLPSIHGDPFDRLLVAQARYEELTIVSRDQDIRQYDIDALW